MIERQSTSVHISRAEPSGVRLVGALGLSGIIVNIGEFFEFIMMWLKKRIQQVIFNGNVFYVLK